MELLKNYPIISIEDPFDENDYEGFKLITEKLSKGLNIVGDDLFVTNKDELQKGIDNKMCNSILIKPNQIGTFLETLETVIKIHEEGRAKRAEAEKTLEEIEKELKAKMLEIHVEE